MRIKQLDEFIDWARKSKTSSTYTRILLHQSARLFNFVTYFIYVPTYLFLCDRKMTVHKFVVKGTVEEHIHHMHQEYEKEGAVELTFMHLRDLFEPITVQNAVQNE